MSVNLIKALTEAYVAIIENAYYTGARRISDNTYDHIGMSEPRWLIRACGLGNSRDVPLDKLEERMKLLPTHMVNAASNGLDPYSVVMEFIELDEEILEDDYPVYGNSFYVVDGKVVINNYHDINVGEFKRLLKAAEVRRCDVSGRKLVD